MEDINITFGCRVRKLRYTKRMTQEELAEAADLSVSFLGAIEHGRKSPTLYTQKKLADALGVSLSELMDFDECKSVETVQKKHELKRLAAELMEQIEQL